jgi:LPS sulfotransferase NodH
VSDRLAAFSAAKIEGVRRKLGPTRAADWPDIDGILAVLFTSRSGSTYLARELESIFAIGQMGEWLNPPRIRGKTADQIVVEREGGWFSLKAGGSGVIAAELCGFFDAYMDRAVFIRLVRRDIVAQAISREKALQTAQFHSTQQPRCEALYDGRAIARSIRLIADGVERIALYLTRVDRPWRTLAYEDFSCGDFSPAIAACDALGAPRRIGERVGPYRPVHRIGDASNLEWAARFREEVDPPTSARIQGYLAALEG